MTSVLEEQTGRPDGADAFMVLGLPYSPDLTDEQVRAAYLLRLRAVHPDNGGDTAAAAAVTAAYDALRSGMRRGELLAAVTVDRDGRDRRPARRRLHWERAARAPSPPARDADGEPAPGTGQIPDAARREELRREVAASRAAQGLQPYITDAATLDKIADLLVVTLGRGEAGKHYPRSAGAAGPARERARQPAWEPSSWRREGRRAYARERLEQHAAAAAVSGSPLVRGWLRVRYGRPWTLAARILLALLLVVVVQAGAPGDPAVWALGVGAVTWLVRSGRFDLAPRARR